MILRVSDIKVPVDTDMDLQTILCRKTGLAPGDMAYFTIYKRSIDAREKSRVLFVYTVDIAVTKSGKMKNIKGAAQWLPHTQAAKPQTGSITNQTSPRPYVIGSGPAGMFAALALAEAGLCPIIIERGSPVEIRKQDVLSFWAGGGLDIHSNVQFGEGGAGAFSDGKLTTGIKSVYCTRILEQLVAFGAPESIVYDAKPHIGTDRLYTVIQNIRKRIQTLGGEYRFHTTLSNLQHHNNTLQSLTFTTNGSCYEEEATQVILAVGHSARDTFSMLLKNGIAMRQKPFAVGVRIEHKQQWLDETQYGTFARHKNPASKLGAADYKLAVRLKDGRGVYTFCMCPGGVVVAAASEEERLVTNGMSYWARDGENANAAILVGVGAADFGSDHPLAGLFYQRKLEEAAFRLTGSYKAPAQRVADFLQNKETKQFGQVTPTYQPGVCPKNLATCLPEPITEALRHGLLEMDKKIKGFAAPDAVLTAVESRSSSPVTILRGDDLQSNIRGLYPCGEGAGYAGGILSAAADGCKCADKCMHNDTEN